MASVGNCFRRFMSVITAVLLALSTIIYAVCLSVVVFREVKRDRFTVFHMLSVAFCSLSLFCYAALHCISLKQRYLLYIITFVLLITFGFLTHSTGLTLLVVLDCRDLGILNHSEFFDALNNPAELTSMLNESGTIDNETAVIGKSGRAVHSCSLHSMVVFAASVTALFQMLALFDVQKVLVEKTKKKMYNVDVCGVPCVK